MDVRPPVTDDDADDESRDYTAEQLAALFNVHLRTAQWWKRGRRLPHIARIKLGLLPAPRKVAPRNEDAELLFGKTAEQLARALKVSLATTQRWKRTGKLPRMARPAIRALMDGDLGVIDPKWAGWSVRNGMLCGPDTYTFRPGEVLAIPFVREQLKNYSAKATAAKDALTWKTQADWIENRYVSPGEMSQDPEAAHQRLIESQEVLRERERIETGPSAMVRGRQATRELMRLAANPLSETPHERLGFQAESQSNHREIFGLQPTTARFNVGKF